MIVNEGGRGGKKLPTLTNPGAAGDLLTGKQLINQNGEILTGTMVNRGAVTQALNAGGSYTIPAGYHNGLGKVTGNSLASQTSATAVAADIKSGKTAWVNGAKVIGTGNIQEETTFGFLLHGIASRRIDVYTDLASSDPNNEHQSRGLYRFEEGDRSAHTLMCTVGSYVTIFIDTYASDKISRDGLTGFDRVDSLTDQRDRCLMVLKCLEPGGSINVETV